MVHVLSGGAKNALYKFPGDDANVAHPNIAHVDLASLVHCCAAPKLTPEASSWVRKNAGWGRISAYGTGRQKRQLFLLFQLLIYPMATNEIRRDLALDLFPS